MYKNNKPHVSTPGIPCGIALIPMKEVYHMMYDDVVSAHVSLVNANSAKTIRRILQEIYQYPVDNRVSENIRKMIEDIKGNVRAMHMNDYTRSEMCQDIEVLLTALIQAIEEEDYNERVENARSTFLFMADNAKEFVKWVDQMAQKQ